MSEIPKAGCAYAAAFAAVLLFLLLVEALVCSLEWLVSP